MTLEEAMQIQDRDIFRMLEDLPDQKQHCIRLTIKTLQKAIDEYKNNQEGGRYNRHAPKVGAGFVIHLLNCPLGATLESNKMHTLDGKSTSKKWARQDSNLRPMDYESTALKSQLSSRQRLTEARVLDLASREALTETCISDLASCLAPLHRDPCLVQFVHAWGDLNQKYQDEICALIERATVEAAKELNHA